MEVERTKKWHSAATGPTVNQLREAMQIQRFLEKEEKEENALLFLIKCLNYHLNTCKMVVRDIELNIKDPV